MKTLIVHPKDSSTSFLDIVYNPIPNKTVITGGVSQQELIELIREHDRVMMMGHGSPDGLFSIGNFDGGYVIDKNIVHLLKNKNSHCKNKGRKEYGGFCGIHKSANKQ